MKNNKRDRKTRGALLPKKPSDRIKLRDYGSSPVVTPTPPTSTFRNRALVEYDETKHLLDIRLPRTLSVDLKRVAIRITSGRHSFYRARASKLND